MRKFSLFLFLTIVGFGLKAQQISIDWIELANDKVILHYTIENANPNHEFLVSLFSSQDNFSSALSKVSGDVGPEIKPGKDKRIVWDVNQELPNFRGTLTFEIRARVFIPFIKLQPASVQKVYKRGKNYPLVWTSGNLSGQINIELYKDQARTPIENNISNTGKYELHIPSSIKKGSGYKLKFTNSKDRNDFVFSPEFSIKPKTPLILKIGAIAVVGAGIGIVAASGGGGSETPPEKSLPANPGKPQ